MFHKFSTQGGIRPHKRFSVQSNRSEVLFVDYIAEHLTQDGRAAVIVPEGIIFQSGNAYKQLRKMLVDKYLVGVISLPAGVFNPYSGVKTSILWLDKSLAKKTDKILFVKISNDGFDLGAQRRAVKGNDLPEALQKILAYKNQFFSGSSDDLKLTSNISLVTKKEVSVNGDYSLSGERYKINEIISSKFNLVPLNDIVEVYDKFRKPITQGDRIAGEYPYYGATGILDYVHEYIFSERLVLVGEDGAKWGRNEKTAFIAQGKYWVNNHAHVLKPITELCIDTYLVEVLNYMDLTPFITGVTVPKLNQAKLREIQIPLPPISMQEEIVAEIKSYQKIIDGARQVVENYKPRIDIDPEWEMVELGDGEYFRIKAGGTPSSSIDSYWNGDVDWATLVDLPRSDYISAIVSTERKITRSGLKNSSAKLIPPESIIVSTRATLGRVAINKVPLATNQGFKNITVINKSVLPYFVALMVKQLESKMNSLATGGTFKELSKTIFCTLQIPLPPLDVQLKMVDTIQEEQNIIHHNVRLIKMFDQKIKDRIAKVWGE